MAKVIPTSFKLNESHLYEEIERHSDKSAFIKECIQFYMDNKTTVKKPQSRGNAGIEIGNILNSL